MENIKFIADIGSNHNQSLERALFLIEQAKKIGCDAVKFQLFHARNLYYSGMENEIKIAESRELPVSFIPKISEYCKNINIEFGMTPFDKQAIDECQSFVDFIKISSFDILRKDFIKRCAETEKPIMFSTGNANYDEIKNALKIIFSNAKEITIFHCISDYPALIEDCELYKIKELKEKFSFIGWDAVKIGWSDHTCNSGVIYGAISEGASTIEFHLDALCVNEKNGDDGYDMGYESIYGHCWGPSDMQEIIKNIRNGEKASMCLNDYSFLEHKRLQRADPEDGLRPCKELRK